MDYTSWIWNQAQETTPFWRGFYFWQNAMPSIMSKVLPAGNTFTFIFFAENVEGSITIARNIPQNDTYHQFLSSFSHHIGSAFGPSTTELSSASFSGFITALKVYQNTYLLQDSSVNKILLLGGEAFSTSGGATQDDAVSALSDLFTEASQRQIFIQFGQIRLSNNSIPETNAFLAVTGNNTGYATEQSEWIPRRDPEPLATDAARVITNVLAGTTPPVTPTSPDSEY